MHRTWIMGALLSALAATACGDDRGTDGTPSTTGGTPSAQGGTPGSGATDSGGTSATGGTESGGTPAQGGTPATGGDSPGTGGTPACSNTTTDPNNCGECGHVCQSGTCNDGVCAADFGDCFTSASGYGSCKAACASNGQICVASGCRGYTYMGWADQMGCTSQTTPTTNRPEACDASLAWDSMSYARCCCTDN